MKPAPKQSTGLVGGRNDPRDRGIGPNAQPRPLTAAQAIGDKLIVLDARGRYMIDVAELSRQLVQLGFVKQ